MKKITLGCLIALSFAVSAYSQGTINVFANTSGTMVTTNNGGVGNAAVTTTKVELFYAASGTLLSNLTNTPAIGFTGLGSAWNTMTLGSNGVEAVTSIFPAAGRFSQGTAIWTGNEISPGTASVYLQVRAWTGGYANWTAAYNAVEGGATGVLLGWTTYQAGSLVNPWLNTLGNPQGTPSTTGPFATGVGNFNGLVLTLVSVPEPSTLALAALGGASLLLFRRRKA